MSARRGERPSLKEPAQGAERVEVTVPEALAGERLDKALAALVPTLSRTRARALIGMGGLYLGPDRCRVASRKVFAGDALTATWHPEVKAAPSFALMVLLEDEHVVAVDKPAGQIVQGTELGDTGTLQRELEKRYGDKIRLMHRLDGPASGVIVAARNRGASGALTPQFRDHTIDRRYWAVTEGIPAEGTCELRLRRDGRRVRVAAEGEEGMEARTEVKVLRVEQGRALVEARLFTGRTHQIRVHLAALGAPLVGDRAYGGPAAARLCLHAVRLGFAHPLGGREVVVEQPPGDDFWEAAGPGLRPTGEPAAP